MAVIDPISLYINALNVLIFLYLFRSCMWSLQKISDHSQSFFQGNIGQTKIESIDYIRRRPKKTFQIALQSPFLSLLCKLIF